MDTSSLYRASATLKGLTSGRNYLVQTWVLDNRSGNYYHRRVTLDGAATMRHNQGTQGGAGSFAVGRFTAASTEQTVYFLYDKDGRVINSENDDSPVDNARFYTIYTAYGNRFLLYIGETNGHQLKRGDTHTFEIAFVRTLSDERKVTARVQVKVTMN